MPADHVTAAARPETVAASVLAVLAGATITTTALHHGLDPLDLADAIDAYKAAGLAALQQRAEDNWYQVRVQFPNWDTAEATAATELGPRLDDIHADGAIGGWWFLRKHPCWRLRLHHADTTIVTTILDDMVTAGAIDRWWPTVYEPETAAFGGPVGIAAIHDLFRADSHGVLTYARQNGPGIGRRELSLVLISALQHEAGLDWFERGDVFDRVAQLRPLPPGTDPARVDALATTLRPSLAIPTSANRSLFAPGGPVEFAAQWLSGFETAGHRLGESATDGSLERGLRTVIGQAVIFHWNRLGLSATTQGILARAARIAILPQD